MRYISNTPAQQKEMLETIGVSSIEDLLVRVPSKARLSRPLNLPGALAASVAEAALMARAVTGRDGVVLSRGLNPLYRQVIETYGEGPNLKLRSVSLGEGATDVDALRKAVSGTTAAVVLQHPNFFGCL